MYPTLHLWIHQPTRATGQQGDPGAAGELADCCVGQEGLASLPLSSISLGIKCLTRNISRDALIGKIITFWPSVLAPTQGTALESV